MIRRLTLTNWRAYDRLDLTFEEGVTFLVAANGVGKSSIVMAAAWGLLGEASNVDAASSVRGGSASRQSSGRPPTRCGATWRRASTSTSCSG